MKKHLTSICQFAAELQHRPSERSHPKIFVLQIKAGFTLRTTPPLYPPLNLDLGSAEETHVFPAQSGLAVLTVDVCHSMQACQQDSLLCRATPNIHPERQSGKSFNKKVSASNRAGLVIHKHLIRKRMLQ